MLNYSPSTDFNQAVPDEQPQSFSDWPTFKRLLQRLHAEGIYIHSDQLAEFLIVHGLPVDLCHVPHHLHAKARVINQNYRGDMAQLADDVDQDVTLDF
ncbi:hypothetical protein IQ268_04920 [Oculatella sp. LEGE 06141]|uniref:hypothetical protein n=1 Tax=Oculatella sp. LEGE 06141 TaxID=1828648 RepID=UPI00187E017F|nr:hypothetical protein [Oculatella sp. LEGE 06141]MBE9177925.1 hypothetical protein [Oculatella sp. LEGE 06141]